VRRPLLWAGLLLLLIAAVGAALSPTSAAPGRGEPVLRATVAGDFIDTDSRHARVWRAWPRDDVSIALGDLVHKNAPDFLWRREWVPRWGSLPPCRVWSVLGNHEWGWSRQPRWVPPAYGSSYLTYRREFHRDCPARLRTTFQWAKTRPGWLIVGLNTEACAAAQDFLTRATGRWPHRALLVLTHRPPILPPGSSAPPLVCPALVRQIDRKADLVLSGHSHRYWRSGKYVVLGTVVDGKGYGRLALYRDRSWTLRYVSLR
jgi:hypothetical protein